MASAGRLVSDGEHRLARLVRAMGEMVSALEAKLVLGERRLARLSDMRSEIDSLASKAHPASLPSVLRSLTVLDAELKQVLIEVESLRRQLLEANGREKAISVRLRLLRDVAERKISEEQALETSLIMMAKASGKRGVV
jgi:hypothetical protein